MSRAGLVDRMMKLLKKMQNPFVLVGQGFLLGGLLFFATHSDSLQASTPAPAQDSILTAVSAPR